MEIRQFRVVVRARSFARSCRFYGESLSLPSLGSRALAGGREAVYQAGPAEVAVLGRSEEEEEDAYDEAFDLEGPLLKLTLELQVPSPEKAYEEALFRDKNIPGGLRHDADGRLVFETHDPDGVKIVLR